MNETEMSDKPQDLGEQAQEWKEKANDWQQAATENARRLARLTDDYVRENTWMSVAVAVCIGCALGFLLGRLRD